MELLKRIEAVSNKRARFVLDSIVKNGRVTTEEINRADMNIRLVLCATRVNLASQSRPSKSSIRMAVQ